METYRLTLEGWAGRSAALGRCASQSAAIILKIAKRAPFLTAARVRRPDFDARGHGQDTLASTEQEA